MSEKPLNPTPEHYGELTRLFETLNSNFYDGALAAPMFTYRPMRYEGCLVLGKWGHKSGAKAPEFRLNPVAFKLASYEKKCMELVRLMEHLQRNKDGRSNYHDREFARAMFMHGLQAHRVGAPEKETGERIYLSVIPGGKFEKFLAKKSLEFSWAIREDDPPVNGASEAEEDGAEPQSSSGKRVKYACSFEGCKASVLGRGGLALRCEGHKDDHPDGHLQAPMEAAG